MRRDAFDHTKDNRSNQVSGSARSRIRGDGGHGCPRCIVLGNGERAGRRISTKKLAEAESQSPMVGVEEEQTLDDEEEEAQAAAGSISGRAGKS